MSTSRTASPWPSSPVGTWAPARADEWPAKWRHIIPGAGYELAQFAVALRDLNHRWQKQRCDPRLDSTLRFAFGAEARPPLVISVPDGPFGLEFGGDDSALQLIGSTHPTFCDPRAWALLHLPALRSWWRQALRAAHWERLRAIIPQAWIVDATPPAPGAVIFGTLHDDWHQLAKEPRVVGWSNGEFGAADPRGGSLLIATPPGHGKMRATYLVEPGKIRLDKLSLPAIPLFA